MGGVGNLRALAVLSFAALALSGCLNIVDREQILPGQRFDTRVSLSGTQANEDGEFPVLTEEVVDAARPISLPRAQELDAWPQRGSNAAGLSPHAALDSGLSEAWSVDIGTGNSRRARLTADPVGADGRIFVMDAYGQVTALTSAGAVLWQADLTAGFDRGGGISGGGLALSGDQVFATTGYGEIVALDVETGSETWRQRVDAGLGTPTVTGGVVYVVSRDSAAWAIDAGSGRVRWNLPASPAGAQLAGGAAPSVANRSVIFPFGSGELVAALRQSGVRVWGTAVAGARAGVAYNSLNDITGDPVYSRGVIYAGNQSGRVVALQAASGTRLWTAEEGAYSPVLVAGGSLFFVSDRNELIRLEADTGTRIWGSALPLFVNERVTRRRAIYTNYGPILAGGALYVASGEGEIRSFDPESGAQIGAIGIRGGAASNPIVMDGTMYVLSGAGRLHAYR